LLGALAVAQVCGVPPPAALGAVQNLQPTIARMQPVSVLNGVTILRDEYNGSIDTLVPALRVLSDAMARRKVLVISDIGDVNLRSRKRMRWIANEAVKVADLMVFVGSHSHYAARAALNGGIPAERVKSFVDLKKTVEYLRSALRPDDLVLLRGRAGDHLSRVYFALIGDIDCWIPQCPLMFACDYCSHLGARPR